MYIIHGINQGEEMDDILMESARIRKKAVKTNEGVCWTLDMLQSLAGSALAGFFEETAEAVKRALTPETRLAILNLKKAVPTGNMICGIEFCKAVLENHVQSWEEFQKWREKNPVETMYYWRPEAKA